jgi:hypothetical protein
MNRPFAQATAEVTTPFRYPHLKRMVHQTGTQIRAAGKNNVVEFTLHAYIATLENVVAAPLYPAVLDAPNSLIVHPHPIDESQSPRANSFGSIARTVSDKRITIAYAPSGQTISEPVVKTLFPRGYGVFALDCLVGVHHALTALGDGFSLLVPEELDDRRRFLLGLTGVRPDQYIEVPHTEGTKLRQALVVSRVFARDPIAEIDGRKRNLRFLVDPIFTKSFNDLVAKRYHEKSNRRIYISRGDATVRRITNEDELIDRLSRFGFEAHQLATLDIEKTVAMFANAEMVVSPHGSGLFNTMFAPTNATVIEIDHPRSDFAAFGIARSLGQRFRVFNKVPENQRLRSNQSHQAVDVDALCELVTQELDRRA